MARISPESSGSWVVMSSLLIPTPPLTGVLLDFSTLTSRWMNSTGSLSRSSTISVGVTSMMVPVEKNWVIALPWKSRTVTGMSWPLCIRPCSPLWTTVNGVAMVWP